MNINLQIKSIQQESFLLTSKIYDLDLLNNLKNFVKNNINQELYAKTNVIGGFTGFNSLVENEFFIKFIKSIKKEILMISDGNFIIKNAWGNLCKKGEEVLEHNHSGIDFFCGILYLTENGPGTYFKEYNININEEIGKFVLFDPLLKHSVPKIENEIERVSIAFNAIKFKSWEDYTDLKMDKI
jgi:hypothetical protein